jgi:transcriptional regulator with XRE-family HTH domain
MLITKDITVVDQEATGAYMRHKRQQKHLSLREVARRLKVSAAYLSDLELGHRSWNQTKIDQFIMAITKP